jgi:hypothetical protein
MTMAARGKCYETKDKTQEWFFSHRVFSQKGGLIFLASLLFLFKI